MIGMRAGRHEVALVTRGRALPSRTHPPRAERPLYPGCFEAGGGGGAHALPARLLCAPSPNFKVNSTGPEACGSWRGGQGGSAPLRATGTTP
jgi:hypothetical protein